MNKPLQVIIGDQLTVICVLWVSKDRKPYQGRLYNWSWVDYLYSAVQRHLFIPHRFICLSNCPGAPRNNNIEIIPLKHNWPAWWSKVECFRPDIPGDRFLYIDLDNIPIGSLDDLILIDSSFIGINPNIADTNQINKSGRVMKIASGVMVWDKESDLSIYESFTEDYFNRFIGDQDYISAVLEQGRRFDLFPDEWIKVLKNTGKNYQNLFKGDARILCCSPGKWRPDCVVENKGIEYQWVNELWKNGEIRC
jgi:hypothetical protein